MFGQQQINSRSIVFNLIMINVVMFVFTSFMKEFMVLHFALFYPANEYFKPHQLLTHMFMHEGIGHIFFNMFALWMFGSVLEKVWGPKRFLTFFLITGFGAVLLHLGVEAALMKKYTGSFWPAWDIVNQVPAARDIYLTPTLGASGAIFGILVGFGVLFPNTEMMLLFFPVPIKAKYLISGYVLIELFMGIAMQRGDNVAHFAHLGGALFGYLLVRYWNRTDRHQLY